MLNGVGDIALQTERRVPEANFRMPIGLAAQMLFLPVFPEPTDAQIEPIGHFSKGMSFRARRCLLDSDVSSSSGPPKPSGQDDIQTEMKSREQNGA